MRCLPALVAGAALGVAVAVALAARAGRLRVDFTADGRVSLSLTGPEAGERGGAVIGGPGAVRLIPSRPGAARSGDGG